LRYCKIKFGLSVGRGQLLCKAANGLLFIAGSSIWHKEITTSGENKNEQGIFHAFYMSQSDLEEEILSEFGNFPDYMDMACSFVLIER
jgi:hypothetical protein